MKRLSSIIVMVLVLVICTSLLTGCVKEAQVATPPQLDSNNVNVSDTDNNSTGNINDNVETPKTNDIIDKDKKITADDKKTEISKPDSTIDKTDKDTSKDSKIENDKTAYLGDDWEIVVHYNNDGLVTEVYARNDDSFQKKAYNGYEGKDYNIVVNELVAAIKNEGYYVDEIDREKNRVTIEINSRYDRDDRFEEKYEKYDWD